MSRQLWRPATDSDGIPFEVLCSSTAALSEWRDEFLSVVGVPSNFEGEWDFVSVSISLLDIPSIFDTTIFQGGLIMRERCDISCLDHPLQRAGRFRDKRNQRSCSHGKLCQCSA